MSEQGPTVFNGRYELLRHIARGGMADVYLARDELLDREVALKVLFPEFANDPSFVERFRREAQAAANLNHPNIVGIYDWGQERGTYYIVMEHVSGRSMADVLRSTGALQPDRAAEIAADVASALSTAHQAGLVHRDVKLGNILVSDAGDVKVADFGIATALAGGTQTGLTQHGSVMGTATYFSPEQAQGKPVDGRSDLYSLGVVLYEMLAGEPPFKADTPVAVAYKHVQERPVPLLERGVQVAPSLNAITMKLLAKNPANRYPTADDLRSDLRRYLAGAHTVPGESAAPASAGAVASGSDPVAGAATTATTTAEPPAADATTALPAAPATAHLASAPATGPQPVVVDPTALAAQYGQDYYYDDDDSDGSWKRTVALLVGLGVLIFILGFLTIAFANELGFGGGGDSTPDPEVAGEIAIPRVTNLQLEDARAQLIELGLVPIIDERPNDTVPEGEVFGQDPPAGQKVEAGAEVTLIVSSGEALKVPVVTGRQQADALAALNALGYQVEVETRADVQDFGTVIAQDPPAGEELAAGQVVTITVSTGPETVAVPDLEGQSLSAAINALVGQGFIVEDETVKEASETIPEGRVIGTIPAKGEFVDVGSRITIVESSGIPMVSVPTVVDLFADTAEQTLRNQGLEVVREFREVPIGDASVGRVIEQNPAAFTEVEQGSTVTIVVGEAAPEPTTTTTTTTSTTTSTTTTTTAPP